MLETLLKPVTDLIDTVIDKAVPDANERARLKKELTEQAMKGEFDILLSSINAVNATMQAEAKSEHWMQWSWRPTIGFTFAAVIINNFVLMPYFAKWVQPISIPAEVWTSMLVILGAAAATRGWEKVSKKK